LNLSFTLIATLLPSGVRASDGAKSKQTQDIPLFGSLTPRCSTRYSVRDPEIASCDTRNIVYACGPRLGAHPNRPSRLRRGFSTERDLLAKGFTGCRSGRLNERAAIGTGVSCPAEPNAGGGVPMRRVRTASSIGTSLVVASSLGTRLSPPIQPTHPRFSAAKGDFYFPTNGILLPCV